MKIRKVIPPLMVKFSILYNDIRQTHEPVYFLYVENALKTIGFKKKNLTSKINWNIFGEEE